MCFYLLYVIAVNEFSAFVYLTNGKVNNFKKPFEYYTTFSQ